MKCFMLTVGDKYYLMQTVRQNVNDSVAKEFIKKICEVKNKGDDLRDRALNDRCTLDDFKRRINRCEYTEVNDDRVHYHKIVGNYFSCSIPNDKADCIIIF